MARAKKIITAAGTFSAALGIGFVMQYGDALASRITPEDAVVLPEQERVMDELTKAATPDFIMPAETNSASLASVPAFSRPDEVAKPVVVAAVTETQSSIVLPDFETPNFDQPVVQSDIAEPAQIEDPLVSAAKDCTVTMTGDVAAMAMIMLDLQAPCHTNAAFVVHHQGMMFTALTDVNGNATLNVPGLSEDAFFIAAFDDGEGAVVQLSLPEMAGYDRAVLQWQGRSDVQLHALEFGAGYQDAGHIWNASIGSPNGVATGTGGYLTRLGAAEADNPMMAEVYTFPSGNAARAGNVVLNVEAEVTTANCGRDIAAQSIQIMPGQEPAAIDLSMTMPGCDAVGEFLVLKNMLKDLTLAAK